MTVEVYENVLTEEQIKELLKIRDRTKKVMNFNEFHDKAVPHFKKFFSMFGIDPSNTSGRYFYTLRPFSIHSDGLSADSGTKQANINILIPLDLEPEGSYSYTIFFDRFDETPDHGRKFYKRIMPEIARQSAIKNDIEMDYSILTNITDKPFDRDIYDEHLKYMKYENLHGLSLHKAVKWKIGDAIKFESNRLHCSSSFMRGKVTSKTHLFFKMYIPE